MGMKAPSSTYKGFKLLWHCAPAPRSQRAIPFSFCIQEHQTPPLCCALQCCPVPLHPSELWHGPHAQLQSCPPHQQQQKPYKGCSLLTDSSSWVLCRSNWIFLMRGRQKPIAISSFSSLLIPYSCRNKTTDTPEPWFFATSSHERRLDVSPVCKRCYS